MHLHASLVHCRCILCASSVNPAYISCASLMHPLCRPCASSHTFVDHCIFPGLPLYLVTWSTRFLPAASRTPVHPLHPSRTIVHSSCIPIHPPRIYWAPLLHRLAILVHPCASPTQFSSISCAASRTLHAPSCMLCAFLLRPLCTPFPATGQPHVALMHACAPTCPHARSCVLSARSGILMHACAYVHTRAPLCTPVHTSVSSCSPRAPSCTAVHPCTPVYPRVLLRIPVQACASLCARASSYIVVQPRACSCIPVHTRASSCTWVQPPIRPWCALGRASAHP